jgi:cytidine deaminase
MTKHEKILAKAVEQAKKSTHRWKMAAVLTKSGRTLNTANNQPKNSPKISGIPLNRCSTHAEVAVTRTMDARGSTVYIARIGRNGEPALAKPCKACQQHMHDIGVKRAVWTISRNSYGVTDLRIRL